MAVGPKQIEKNLEEEAINFEVILDSALNRKSVSPNGSVTLGIPSGMSYSHFQVLKPKYISAGWKNVNWHSDQRDGDYLEFIN